MTIQKLAINTLVILGTLLLIFLLWEFRQAFIMFIFSLAVAAAARPTVDFLSKRGWSRNLVLLLVYLVSIGAFLALLLLVGNSLLREIQQLVDNLARMYDQIWNEWPQGTEIQQMLVQQLPAPAELYASFSPERQNSFLNGLLGFTISSASFLGNLVAILILSIYWSIDRVHFERLWLSLFPVESRARYRDIWRDIEQDFGAYVRSELFQSLLAGVLLGAGYWLMGLPYPTLLAVYGALAWLIPWLGGVLAIVPVALVGFATNLGLGITASVYALAVLIFLEFFIEPRFSRRRQYSSLLNILLILALVEPFGLLGFIIAPPLAAAIELAFRYSLQNRPVPLSLETVKRIAELRQRIDTIHELLANDGVETEPQTTNILNRLEDLVDRAEDVMHQETAKQQQRSRGRVSV